MPFPQRHVLFNKFIKTTVIDAAFYLSIYLYIAFLSPYFGQLGWSESLKGWFFAIFSIVGIFAAPVIGTLSDKIGRFRIILIGLVLEIVATAGYVIIDNTVALFFVRALSAIAFNAVTITALSRVNDTILDNKKRGKQTGAFHSIISIAAIVSPLAGGWIADNLGYEEVFLVAIIVMVIVLLALMIYDFFFYRDDKQVHRKKEKLQRKDFNPFSDVRDMLRFKGLRNVGLLGMAANFPVPLLVLVYPYIILEKMGRTNIELSMVLFLMGAVHVMQYFLGRAADNYGKGKSIVLGQSISAITLIAMFFVPTYEWLMILIVIRALGGALWNVSVWAYMSDIAEKHNIEGKVVGSYTSLARIMMAISFIVSGFLLEGLGVGIFLVYGGVVLAALMLLGNRIIKYEGA